MIAVNEATRYEIVEHIENKETVTVATAFLRMEAELEESCPRAWSWTQSAPSLKATRGTRCATKRRQS